MLHLFPNAQRTCTVFLCDDLPHRQLSVRLLDLARFVAKRAFRKKTNVYVKLNACDIRLWYSMTVSRPFPELPRFQFAHTVPFLSLEKEVRSIVYML